MDNSKQGGWVTKHYLTKEKHWTTLSPEIILYYVLFTAMHWFNMYTIFNSNPIFKIQPRSMVNAAVDWAKSKNLWRVNPSIRRRKIKVVVDDFFRFSEARRVRHYPAWHYGNGGPFTVPILFPAPHLSFRSNLLSFLACQDHDGALLDAGDMIPERMSKPTPRGEGREG